jgi:holliday junction DNA helicase RuvB
MASCLANEMYAPLVSTSGQCINTATDLRNILVRLKPGTMLLIDEAHCLGRMAAEELLLVLEEGVLNVNLKKGGTPVRIRVPPFTLILATTQPAALSAPLIQRFGLHFRFGFYSADELRTIISNATKRMDVEFDGGVCIELARRARGVPRIALRLTDRVRDIVHAKRLKRATSADCLEAMELEGIDAQGLHEDDRTILRSLLDAEPRPVSARSLALVLGAASETVTDVLEPTLVRLGFVTIGTGGRRLTEKGRQHIESVTVTGDAAWCSLWASIPRSLNGYLAGRILAGTTERTDIRRAFVVRTELAERAFVGLFAGNDEPKDGHSTDICEAIEMRIPPEGTRMNVTTTAALFEMDPGHFRRLVRRGVLPRAKRTSKSMPYYDHTLMERIHGVLRTGVGCNGEEIAFYRRRSKTQRPPTSRRGNGEAAKKLSSFLESVMEGCRQLGVDADRLTPASVSRALLDEFGVDFEDHPLEEVIPVVILHLQGARW